VVAATLLTVAVKLSGRVSGGLGIETEDTCVELCVFILF
jgi:hypothetical protein